MGEDLKPGFESFFAEAEQRLRAALVARYGGDRGREAAAEALGYGWQNWDRVRGMENPAGYLYRIGDRWAKRQAIVPTLRANRAEATSMPHVEPGLDRALATLSLRQRQAVVLIAGFGLTHEETGRLLGLARSSVQNHVERGLAKLRSELGVRT